MRTVVAFTTLLAVFGGNALAQDAWRQEVLLETERGMGGAAIGDLDAATPGNEVAIVTAGGEVWLVGLAGDEWRPQRIHAGDGEMIMCAIGDVDPRYAGNEFVGVGMVAGEESLRGPGQVTMVRKDGDGWKSTPIFQDDHMLHGVAIGNVSARHEGTEVIACGFSHRVMLLWLEGDAWQHETIYVGNDRMKIVLAADILPERDGLEVLACGSDGNVVLMWETELGWQHELVYADPTGQSRIAAAKSQVLIGGDGGKVTLAKHTAAGWATECITRDVAKMRGVAIIDADTTTPGPEYYSCGYSGCVTQSSQDEHGYWHSQVINQDARPLHHLVAGEFDARHEGPEFVTCGHGGRLLALYSGNTGRTELGRHHCRSETAATAIHICVRSSLSHAICARTLSTAPRPTK